MNKFTNSHNIIHSLQLKTNKHIRSRIGLLLKVILIGLLSYTIYTHLMGQNDLSTIWQDFKQPSNKRNLWLFILTAILMLVNWNLEAYKWRIMVNKYHAINQLNSLKAIFMGLSIGILTPNRVGEFAGRLLMVPKDKNFLSIKANIYNGLAQNIATYIFGLGIILFFIDWIDSNMIVGSHVLIAIIAILVMMMFIVFFNLDNILNKLHWLPKPSIFNSWDDMKIYHFSLSTKNQVLLLSVLRFFVYVLQYLLLLQYFGNVQASTTIFALIILLFTIQSLVPLPPMVGVLAKGELSLLIFTQIGVNEITILAATLFIWIINLAIPSLIGIVLIMKTQIAKTIGFE